MTSHETSNFAQLADGTWLERQADGSYRPIQSETNHAALAALTDDDIEKMSRNESDHPPLDDAFWVGFDARQAAKEAISIKLDEDILAYFRQGGRGYQTRINAVLRHYVDALK